MNDQDLINVVQQDVDNCRGAGWSEISNQRSEAMEYYLGEKYGNEEEGRSQVVTSEVTNAIEWIKPQLLKIFTSSNKVVEFEPEGPQDIASTEQETGMLNHAFYKDNDGFHILYTWFNDALLQKNGIIKFYWDESEEIRKEDLIGLDEASYVMLLQDPNVEVVGYEEQLTEMGVLYNCNIHRKIKKGQLRVINVPPERFLIYDNYHSLCLNDVPFCAQETEMTKEQLLDQGYPMSLIKNITFDNKVDTSQDESRWDDIDSSSSNIAFDNSTCTVYECYKRVDFDKDGYAELRKITYADEVLLDNEEIDYIPFVAITPVIMSHRFYGRSIADLIMHLQLIKSTLLRNILDNLYQINNQRTVIVDGEVNIDDVLDGRIGGVVRATAPGMVEPFPITPFSGHAFQMLEYIDNLGENNTGVTKYTQGLDGDSLNKTATGVTKIMNASQERVKLIARVFAQGLVRLFIGMHRLLQQNQQYARMIRLNDQWVSINPSEWKNRNSMTINVGLGSGDSEQELMHLNMILQMQKEAMAAGATNIVTPQHVFNTLTKIVETAGFKDPTVFFADPKTAGPMPQQKPDPQMAMIQMTAQVEQMKNQIDQQELKIKAFEAQAEARFQERKLELEEMSLTGEYIKDQQTAQADSGRLALSKYQTDIQAEVEREKIVKQNTNKAQN